ncbi:MAG: YtxH domain-containing protein [Planctomycetes bacterium]|nr:YtxH domain-containing protein [Planctomycetota bacterium]
MKRIQNPSAASRRPVGPLLGAALTSLLLLTGCPDGSAEKAGAKIDDAVEDVKDKAEDVKDKAEDMADKTEDAVEAAADEVEKDDDGQP